jgi:long-chain acyl-CoA synthetase
MTTSISSDSSHKDAAAAMPWLSDYPKDVDWHAVIAPAAVHTLLEDAARRYPGNICTSFLGRTTTYAEMVMLVDRFAAGLQRIGVVKGTKVGLFLPNSPTFIMAYFAVLKAGGTVVNFNPLYAIEELEHQIRDSETELMITLDLKVLFPKVETLLARGTLQRAVVASFPALLPMVKQVLFRLAKRKDLADVARSPQRGKIVTQDEIMRGTGTPVPVAIDPQRDLAVLQYTGGTTGTPKGAMLTHGNLTSNVDQVVAWAGALEDGKERVMGILPFFHVFAMTVVMNFGIRKAAHLVLMPKFEINEALKLMQQVRPTMMPGVPTLFNALLNHKHIADYDLTALKFCLSGGAALPLEVKKGFEQMTGAKLVEGYGLSETSPVATCNPVGGKVKEGSIGQPLPGTRISIRSLEDPFKEMPLMEPGEVCIAGPQVMPGYWKKPAETEAVFTDGYFRTGDIGYMDADGFTFIVDRLKDMINASGFKVYPREIEEALYEHEAVEEVTVIGIPNTYRGEAPKAFVKLKPDATATPQALLEFLKPKLAKHKLPEEIEIRASLPKTAVGKLSKKELKAEEMAKRQG